MVVAAFDFDTGEVAFTVENTPVRIINAIRNEIRIIVDFLNTVPLLLENFMWVPMSIFEHFLEKLIINFLMWGENSFENIFMMLCIVTTYSHLTKV